MDTVASHGHCFSKVSLGQPFSTTTIQKRHALGKKGVLLRRRVIRHHAVRIHSQAGFGRGTVKIKEEEEEAESTESEPTSGTKKLFKLPLPNKLPGTVKLQNKGQSQAKSNKVVFVAGATGKVGSRTVRELLQLGFSVRACTRNVEKAQALFEDVASASPSSAETDDAAPFGIFSPAKLFGFLKPKQPGKRLEIVECNLEDPEAIEPALGNAGVVVCCIGASEKEVLDVTGPYRIDFKATENLINAASSAEVSHFVLLTSLGTQKFGFPAAVLNLFWGVLLWKAKAEKSLIRSGLPYTIVRPGGMERPTDAYKETHNLILAEADKLFGGQVSNLQVAELLASIIENPDVSVNKIVEAVAETTAPLRPIKELLEELPAIGVSGPSPRSFKKAKPPKADIDAKTAYKEQDEEKTARNGRALALKEREEKRIQAEKLAEEKRGQAQKEKEQKRAQAERDEKEKQRLQALRKKYEEEIEVARDKEEAARSAAAAALAEKAELEKRAAEIRAKAEAAALAASQAKAVEAAVLTAARKGDVLSDEEKEKIMESVRLARLPKEAAPAEQPKPSLKKKPAFSFLGRARPSSTTSETTETEPTKEAEKEEDPKVKAKADKEDKRQEKGKLKKEQEAKKLAEAKKRDEQERLDKEAKERAEKESAEAKQKQEAEAKRKEEELAEAKKKEEEEKGKMEAEAKKEEKKELAEAKRKEEEAEAKKKEEEVAEAKEKEEEEKANKEAEAEQKAKESEEEEAAAKQAVISAATDKEVEEEPKEAEARTPRRKGFRWFWQPPQPDTPEEEESTEEQAADVRTVEAKEQAADVPTIEAKEEVADVPTIKAKEEAPDVPTVEAKVAEQLPPYPTPLSPYTRYPGLKPPARPIASAPAPKAEKEGSPRADAVTSEINGVDQSTANLELPPQDEPAVVPEEPSEELQDDIEARTQKTQETAAREKEALEKAQASVSFKWPWQKPEASEEESTATLKEEEIDAPQEPASSTKEQEAVPPAIESQDKTTTLPPSSRPLSPYAQFPNLKPPSPPKASSAPQNGSAENSKPAETLADSSSPLSPYPGFPDLKPPMTPGPLAGNGAMPADEDKEEEKISEPAVGSGFKWPWQQ